jgi:hypothetical protein
MQVRCDKQILFLVTYDGEIHMMKKLLVVLCTGVMLGSAGSVLAKDHRVSICHNGSTYNEETEMEDPISFVITIAGKAKAQAVQKHVANHGDLETYAELGEGLECELVVDDATGESTVECSEVMLCGSADPL